MKKLTGSFILFALFSLFSYISFLFINNNFFAIGITTFIVTIISVFIFTYPKAYPFKFMYPGLLTFFLFMALPIIFTIYIGFTNLSTGHFLSKDQVYDILTNETFIPEQFSNNEYFFDLYEAKEKNIFNLFVNNKYSTQLNLKSKQNIYNLKLNSSSPSSNKLSKGEVYKLRSALSDIQFILPEKLVLRYFRTNKLAPLKNRYIKLGDGALQDVKTSTIYSADDKNGFYVNGENNIVPGFFVNVGLKNFISLFKDKGLQGPFLKIFLWTFIWALTSVFLAFSLGMFLALVVNAKKLKMKSVYRIFLIIPYSIPFFISVLIFKGMFNKDFGVINEVLASLGMTSNIDWLGNPIWAKISCLITNLWLGFPYMFLVTTGILQSIPESVYEAASLDGAGRFRTFRSITLPLIFSAIAPLLVGTFAFNFNNFVGIYLLTGGGPPIIGATTAAGETDILISYTYKLAFEGGMGQHFGLASSIAIIIFIIIATITMINFKLSGILKEEK